MHKQWGSFFYDSYRHPDYIWQGRRSIFVAVSVRCLYGISSESPVSSKIHQYLIRPNIIYRGSIDIYQGSLADCWLVMMLGKWILGRFPCLFIFYIRNETYKQYNLSDKLFNYILYLGLPGEYLYLSPKSLLADQRVVGLFDFFINVFLEVQDSTCS